MPQTWLIDSFNALNLAEHTTLDADVIVGATTATVVNSGDGILSGDNVVLGQVGSNASEVVAVSGVTTTSLTISAAKVAHKRFEDVTKLFADKVRIYRASNVDGTVPDDSLFSLQATIAIDYDQSSTSYTDATGSQNYWYKFTYFNSGSSAETSLGDATPSRGGGYGHYVSIADVKDEAGLKNNLNIPEALVDSRRIEAEAEIDSALYNVYTLPFTRPVPPQITEVNRLIAAGLVLLKEYGPMTGGAKNIGHDKLNQGRKLLERIQARQQVLLAPNGTSLLNQPAVTSWPNATTDQSGTNLSDTELAANNQDRGPKIRSSMVF